MKRLGLLLLIAAIVLVGMPVFADDGLQSTELIELRTENSKTFDISGGERQVVVSMGAIHYKDDYVSNEQWKDIDLTWEGNRITKAPYELTLEGKKLTLRDKKTGDISTIELLEIGDKSIPDKAWEKSKGLAKAPGIVGFDNVALDTDLEIVAEFSAVKFTRVLKSDKAPKEAKFQVTGNFRVRASDEDGDLPVEATLKDGILTETLKPDRPVKYPVRIDPTWQVGASTDDCHRRLATSAFSLVNGYLAVGAFDATYRQYGGGMRFLNITIPNAQVIDSAHLILRASADRSGEDCNSRISAEAVDDAPTFADDAAAFDARWANRTTAIMDWDAIPAWTSGTDYNSPTTDGVTTFASIIQEIVDRGSWASGNDIVIFWEDFEDRSSSAGYRTAHSYDGSTDYCPQLVIDYSPPPPVAPVVTAQNADVVSTTATLNGDITATGNGNCTERGFVWGTTQVPNPVGAPAAGYDSSWTETGSFGTGAFSYDAEGLTELTTYYFRACAESALGTWAYSRELSFFIGEAGKVYLELRPDLDETKIRGQLGIPSDIVRGIYNGYSLPITDLTDNETLSYIVCVPGRWDGESDILVHIDCATTDNETGNTYVWRLEWQHITPNEDIVPNDAHGLSYSRDVYSEETWQSFQDWLVIPYDLHAIDDPPDQIVADDLIALRLSRMGAPKNDTGEIAVFAIDVLFARGDFLGDPAGYVTTIIEEWMEENMEEIGIQFGVFNTILEGWSVYFLLFFGLIFLLALSYLAFWKFNVVLFMLVAGSSIIYGFCWYDAFTTTLGLALGLMMVVYALVCLGFAFKCIFWTGKEMDEGV